MYPRDFRVFSLVHDVLNDPSLTVPRPSHSIWPSGCGVSLEVDGLTQRFGGCSRQQYYRWLKYPQVEGPETIESVLKRRWGEFFSQELAEIAKRERIYIGDEVKIEITKKTKAGTVYRIGGAIDLILQHQETGAPIFIECKSKGEFAAPGLINPTKGNAYTAPKELMPDLGECVQCMLYMDWMRGPPLHIAEPRIHLLYVTRDRIQKSEHVLFLQPDGSLLVENDTGAHHIRELTLQAIYEDTDHLADSIKAKKAPARPYERQYSDERIRWMYEHKKLNKTDRTTVEKRMKSGVSPLLDKGDWRCDPRFCAYSKGCYEGGEDFVPGGQKPVEAPVVTNTTEIKADVGEAPV